MFDKMIVRGRSFEDDGWEDPSLSGWLMVYCIWMAFSIIAGVAGVFQLPYVPGWAKALGYLAYLLPVYSLVGVLMRWRNAVAASMVSLLLLVINGIVSCVILTVSTDEVGWSDVLGVVVNICWMLYFMKSHLVSVRFPEDERRVSVIDGILFGVFISACGLLNVSALSSIARYDSNVSEEYRETIEAASELAGICDHGVHFVDIRIDGNYCRVYFAADDMNISTEDFNSIVNQPYFSDMLLYKIDSEAPDFLRSAIGDGLVLVFTVFRKNINDGVSFKITPDQVSVLKEPEALPDLTDGELEYIRVTVEGMIPSSDIKGVSIRSVEWLNERVLLVGFELDEDMLEYMDAYPDFKAYADRMQKMLMKNRSQPVLDAVWSRNMSIEFVLKGSRTGYAKKIPVF